MRRNILLGCATALIVVAMMLNVNISSKNYNLSDMALANVEALAENEGGGDSGGMKIKCGDDDAKACKRYCYNCGAEYTSENAIEKKSTGLKGKCYFCGELHSDF